MQVEYVDCPPLERVLKLSHISNELYDNIWQMNINYTENSSINLMQSHQIEWTHYTQSNWKFQREMSTKIPANFYEATLPLYYFFRFFGLAPFSYEGPSGLGNFQSTFIDKIWTLILLCVHCFSINILKHISSVLYKLEKTNFLSANWQIFFFYVITGKILNVAQSFLQRHNLANFLKVLKNFDEVVSYT
jgi:hypothetical protein